MDKCKKVGCKNNPLSFCDHCGKHATEEEIKKILKHLNEGENVTTLNLARREWENIEINSISIQDFDSYKSTFKECSFRNINFGDLTEISATSFEQCHFIKCSFSGAKIKDCYFKETNFKECSFEETLISSTLFLEDTFFQDCRAKILDFSSVTLDESEFSGFVGDLIGFVNCEVSTCKFQNSKFNNLEFLQNHFFNSIFNNSYFSYAEHDLNSSLSFDMCLFNNSEVLEPVKDSKDYMLWNNHQNEDSISFYKRIISQVESRIDKTQIESLALSIEFLYTHAPDEYAGIKTNIQFIYRSFAQLASQTNDFGILADIFDSINLMPDELKSGQLALPDPSINIHDGVILRIHFEIHSDSLNIISQLLEDIAHSIKFLPEPDKEPTLLQVQKGSYWIELLFKSQTNVATLIASIGATTFVVIKGIDILIKTYGTSLDNKKKKLEGKDIEDKLAYDRELRKIDLQIKRARKIRKTS